MKLYRLLTEPCKKYPRFTEVAISFLMCQIIVFGYLYLLTGIDKFGWFSMMNAVGAVPTINIWYRKQLLKERSENVAIRSVRNR